MIENYERFTFEWIRNTKEQIYFYERAENQKVKWEESSLVKLRVKM